VARFRRPFFWFIRQVKVINPRNAVVGTRKQLKLPVGNLSRAPELLSPFGRAPRVFNKTGCWCEAGKRHVRCCIRRNRHRVNRYIESPPLSLPVCLQAGDIATDHGRVPLIVFSRTSGGHVSVPPLQPTSLTAV